MKSLDQIRSTGIPVNAINTPGDANNHFIVSQPGSYYLTGNLSVSEANAIDVTAADVTIDLNGFLISRSGGSGGLGITINADRCRLVNGSISGFGFGVAASTSGHHFRDLTVSGGSIGIIVTSPSAASNGTLVESCVLRNNTSFGMFLGNGGDLGGYVVRNCVASGNGGAGFLASDGTAFEHCAAIANTSHGFQSSGTATVSFAHCVAYHNSGSGFVVDGAAVHDCTADSNSGDGFKPGNTATTIPGVNGPALKNCVANNNSGNGFNFAGVVAQIEGCSAYNNGTMDAGSGFILKSGLIAHCYAGANKFAGIIGATNCNIIQNTAESNINAHGISVSGSDNRIEGNTANGNGAQGIMAVDRSVIINNIADGNGGSGIQVNGSFNRIENNQAAFNSAGYYATTANGRNFFAKNTARGNSGAGNFVIAAGNRPAAIVVPTANAADITGANSGSSDGFTNTDPWANFSY